jgi:ABC-type phosphate transport system permease subunit
VDRRGIFLPARVRRESQGPLTRAIRIAVNNLAGVPSIVYGVFGLGFFVYLARRHIDQSVLCRSPAGARLSARPVSCGHR